MDPRLNRSEHASQRIPKGLKTKVEKVDLLRSVQEGSVNKLNDFIIENGISLDSKCLDYTIINTALKKGRKDIAKFLIDRNYVVNRTTTTSSISDTPLHYAVKMEDMELVSTLLDKNASIIVPNDNGDTPIHLAFMRRQDIMVDAMFNSANHTKALNMANKHGLTHMHIACARDNSKVVENFLDSGVDINIRVNCNSPLWAGYTPMHFAVEFTSVDVIKLLVNAGASIFTKDAKDVMPIHLGRLKYLNASMANYFSSSNEKAGELGVDSKITNFHIACMKDDPVLVKAFIDKGASVHKPIMKSAVFCPLYSPLHFAVESNCIENVQLLLNEGVEIEQQNEYYMTALHLALYNEDHKNKNGIVDLLYTTLEDKSANRTDLNGLNYFHIACTRNDLDLVQKFLDAEEDVNSQIFYNLRNFAYYSPLHFAVRYGHGEMVQLLIKYGGSVNRSDNGMHGTPLHLAFEGEDEEIIEILLKNGARGNVIRPFDDKSLLHVLVEKLMDKSCCDREKIKLRSAVCKLDGNSEYYIKKLVRSGCDINAKDSDGNTALHFACTKLRDGIKYVRFLLDWGADINIENNVGRTPFDMTFLDSYKNNAEDYMTLYHHVKALDALGVKINPKNNTCCDKILDEKNKCEPGSIYFMEDKLNIKSKQRTDEVAKLKFQRIDKRTSLYDIIFDNPGKLAQHVKNTIFQNVIDSRKFKSQYPTYGYLLQLQFQRGMDCSESVKTEELERSRNVDRSADRARSIDRSRDGERSKDIYRPIDRSRDEERSNDIYRSIDRSRDEERSKDIYRPIDRSRDEERSKDIYRPIDRSRDEERSKDMYRPRSPSRDSKRRRYR